MSEEKLKIARQFVGALPHSSALAMTVTAVGEGSAEIEMTYDERLIGDPETGVIHGGAVSALLDTCGGVAVMSHPGAGHGTATMDLRIDYMRPATPGQAIRASAHCYHVTRTVAFVRATACDDDAEHPVAAAAGAFTMERKG